MIDLEAISDYRLAPLNSRRDMAMLGLIHRTVIGEGPDQFKKYFVRESESRHPDGRENQRRHDKQLISYRKGKFLDIMATSALGLIDVYNLLPQATVDADTVPKEIAA